MCLVLAAATAACLSDRAPVAPAGEQADCRLPVDAVRRGDRIVVIRNFAFVPDTVTVEPGRSVTWVNCEADGTEPHTSTDDAGAWNSSLLHPGDSYSRTFGEEGEHGYFCLPHPAMRGHIHVRSP